MTGGNVIQAMDVTWQEIFAVYCFNFCTIFIHFRIVHLVYFMTLIFFLRTLQSPIGPQGSEVTHVKKLKLRCSDNFFLESSISSDHFGQLPQLEDLQIKFCKLRTIPAAAFAGLTSLRRLALQSHNAVIMELHQDTFQVSKV